VLSAWWLASYPRFFWRVSWGRLSHRTTTLKHRAMCARHGCSAISGMQHRGTRHTRWQEPVRPVTGLSSPGALRLLHEPLPASMSLRLCLIGLPAQMLRDPLSIRLRRRRRGRESPYPFGKFSSTLGHQNVTNCGLSQFHLRLRLKKSRLVRDERRKLPPGAVSRVRR
jgi:hypothetical protein